MGTAILRERQSSTCPGKAKTVQYSTQLHSGSYRTLSCSGVDLPLASLNPTAHSPSSLAGVSPPAPFPLSHEFGCSLYTPPAPAPQTTGTRLLYPTLTPLMGEWKERHEVPYKPSLVPTYNKFFNISLFT